MAINPLFDPSDEDDKRPAKDDHYVLSNRHGRKIEPLHKDIAKESGHPAQRAKHASAAQAEASQPKEANAAAELIRRKIDALYSQEPDAQQEEAEVKAEPVGHTLSPHQKFMQELTTSGKSLAEIQTAWHEYYIGLPDAEKHAVWQEFYDANNRRPSAYGQFVAQQPETPTPKEPVSMKNPVAPQAPLPAFPGARTSKTESDDAKPVIGNVEPGPKPRKAVSAADKKAVAAVKNRIKKHVKMSAAAQQRAKHHVHSLLFGLATGTVVILIVLFGLFNQLIITPFIQPSSHANATPIILNTDSVAPTATPEVIIPKINVEIPVDYTQTTTDENAIEDALLDATVHYPSTSRPGEKGNAAIFGHSSNNIFNPGKYKFAFVLLHNLVPGDIFYLTYNDKVYTYRVFDKQIVSPDTVSVLNPVEGKVATATLITCDPPGTSLNRLIVWGEQINPDPSANADATGTPATAPERIVSNGPTLWQRLTSWL